MKKCTKCRNDKPLFKYDKKGLAKNGKQKYSSHCKECRKKYIKSHYNRNKEYYISKSKIKTALLVKKCNEYIKKLFCYDCGFSFKNFPSVCDFHHVHDKKTDVSKLKKVSFNAFINEVKKCIPLCANCHRIRHSKQMAPPEEFESPTFGSKPKILSN